MATSQLSLYNEALLLVGERELNSLTDDVESRYRLDTAFTNGVDYCLELVNPVFARKTSVLTVSTAGTTHAYPYVFELPNDYISLVGVYSDNKLDQSISRFIIEGRKIASEHSTIYLRYITNSYQLTTWDKSFERFVVAYLASEIAPRIAPDEMDRINATYQQRLQQALQLNVAKESNPRPSDEGSTLTNEWRRIYNKALQLLGLEELTSNDDDSIRKVKLDVALSSDLVESLLETTGWNWAITTAKIQVNPSLEPEWGYSSVFDKPDNMQRLDGVFVDEYLSTPLKNYKDEGAHIFAEVDTIFVQYVNRDYLNDPASWPAHFRQLVSAALAKDTALVFGKGAQERHEIYMNFKDAEIKAKNIDVMQSPPRLISSGSWVKARFKGYR